MSETSQLLEFQTGLQAALVPPVLYSGRFLEAFGRSVPKEEMGGDLADLLSHGQEVIAYVMDASGHGLRAGMLMGMAKTAFRYGLVLGQPFERLFRDINTLLHSNSIKERNMFVTLAALRFTGTNQAEYISAGHVPLLQYQRQTGNVVRHDMSELPLGLFPGARYVSHRIACEAGDIFALVTDGVVETGENPDVNVGLERLAGILRESPGRSLGDIMTAMLAEAAAGPAQDDATVLLLRCSGEASETRVDQADFIRTREATWQMLLDELAEELSGA